MIGFQFMKHPLQVSETDNFGSIKIENKLGALVGTLNGEPICMILANRYETEFGFLGCYITKKEFRGKGYGIEDFSGD